MVTKEKLFEKTRKNKNGCILWTKSVDEGGYGKLTCNYKTVTAHRLSYTIFKGPIPKGMLVCHHCDVRRCINPDHLFLGTHRDNSLDSVKKGRFGKPIKLNSRLVKDIRRKYESGRYTQENLAFEYNVSKSTIWDIVKYNHWIPVDESIEKIGIKQKRSYKNKITFEDAQKIRDQYKTGQFTQRSLALKYNISQQTVFDLIHLKHHKPK